MITTENGITTIKCDKCLRESTALEASYNDVFWDEGWALNKGRKYMHLCNSCLPKKSMEAMKRMKEMLLSANPK